MNKGFTLIEIIAVLVLLGVLAAVIVPRYNNIITEAKTAALDNAIAEGIARVNAGAAQYLLQNSGTIPTSCTAFNLATDAGEYTLSFADSGTTGCTVTATDGTLTKSKTALLPQEL